MLRALALAAFLPLLALAPGDGATVLPEVRRHLDDGWACLRSDPRMARAHALAVLGGEDVRVEVDLDAVPRKRRTVCRAAVDEALEAWERAVGDGFRLRRADEGKRCPIVVRFLPEVREDDQPVAGYVDWKRTTEGGEGRMSGDVRVRTVDPDGAPMPMRAMRQVVIHEMGHLLGLDDSDRVGDAMGPLDVRQPIAAPTDAEAAAVRGLRREAERLLKETRG